MIGQALAQETTTSTGQPAPVSQGQSFLIDTAPFLLIGLIFYFLLFRPQQQKLKQQRETLSQLRRGDKVVTAGGIIGTIARIVSDDEVLVDVTDTVRLRVVRSTIGQVLSRTEPAGPAESEVVEGEVIAPAARGKRPAPGADKAR